MVTIYPETGDEQIRRLGAAVILQAIADLKSKDTSKALDAMLFLRGDDFPVWAEISGLPFVEFKVDLASRAWRLIARQK